MLFRDENVSNIQLQSCCRSRCCANLFSNSLTAQQPQQLNCSSSHNIIEMSFVQTPLLAKLDNYGERGLKSPIRGKEIAELLQDNCSNLIDFLPCHTQPAICEPRQVASHALKPLSHQQLKNFVEHEFDLEKHGVGLSQRVGIIMPNGASLAVAILCVMSKWCAAPINIGNTFEEIVHELKSSKSVVVMILKGEDKNEQCIKAAQALHLPIIELIPSSKMPFLFISLHSLLLASSCM